MESELKQIYTYFYECYTIMMLHLFFKVDKVEEGVGSQIKKYSFLQDLLHTEHSELLKITTRILDCMAEAVETKIIYILFLFIVFILCLEI